MLNFSHLLVGVTNFSAIELDPYNASHSIISAVEAFSQLRLSPWTWPPVQIITEPRIYLLKRKLTNV